VVNIDKEAKVVMLEGGAKIQYNSLLSTLPLDVMLRWFGKHVGALVKWLALPMDKWCSAGLVV